MRLERALAQARVSVEIEGLKIKPQYTSLVKARLNDEISEEEFQQKVKDIIKT